MKGVCVFLLGFLMLRDIKFGESKVTTFPLGYSETDSTEDATMDPTTTEEPYITPGSDMWFANRKFGCPGNDQYCSIICQELNFRGGHCVSYLFKCQCYDCLEEEELDASMWYKCRYRPYVLDPPRKPWWYI